MQSKKEAYVRLVTMVHHHPLASAVATGSATM
jgi:hypothetical protein